MATMMQPVTPAARLSALDMLQEEMEGCDTTPTTQPLAYPHSPYTKLPASHMQRAGVGAYTPPQGITTATSQARLQGVYSTGSMPVVYTTNGGRQRFILVNTSQGSVGYTQIPMSVSPSQRTAGAGLMAGARTPKLTIMLGGYETFDGTLAQMPLPIPGFSVHIAPPATHVDNYQLPDAMNEGVRQAKLVRVDGGAVVRLIAPAH